MSCVTVHVIVILNVFAMAIVILSIVLFATDLTVMMFASTDSREPVKATDRCDDCEMSVLSRKLFVGTAIDDRVGCIHAAN